MSRCGSGVRRVITCLGLMLPLLTGCHSAFVQATVTNQTGKVIPLFEVDYPSASFGGGGLASEASFHYRFKILGSGPAKLIWTDAAGAEHTAVGPSLEEGQEGQLTVVLQPSGIRWEKQLTPSR